MWLVFEEHCLRVASGKYFLKIPSECHGLKKPNNRNTLSFKKVVAGWSWVCKMHQSVKLRNAFWTSGAAFLATTVIWKGLLHLQNVKRLQSCFGSKVLNYRNIRYKLKDHCRGKQECRQESAYHFAVLLHELVLVVLLQVFLSCKGLKQTEGKFTAIRLLPEWFVCCLFSVLIICYQ